MMRVCPACHGEMRYEERRDEVVHLGRKRVLDTLGWWCTSCGEAILEGEALQAREKAFLELHRAEQNDARGQRQ